MSDDMTLKERVDAFALMELPGQPRMMHMGTSYLVNDLWREIDRLQRQLDEERENYLVGILTDDTLAPFLANHICCSGHECGCQGATVGSYIEWLIKQ